MIVVMIGAWAALESRRFMGVPIGDKIAERQRMIAEIESRFDKSPSE